MLARIELSAQIARNWHRSNSRKRVELHQAHLNHNLIMKVPKSLAWVLTVQVAQTCQFVETILVDHVHDNQNARLLILMIHLKLQLNPNLTRVIVAKVRRLRSRTVFSKCLHRRQTKWHHSMRPKGNLKDESLTSSNQMNQVIWKT